MEYRPREETQGRRLSSSVPLNVLGTSSAMLVLQEVWMYSTGVLLQMDFVNDVSLGGPHGIHRGPPHKGGNRSFPKGGLRKKEKKEYAPSVNLPLLSNLQL